MDFIKNNKYTLFFVLGIVGIALMIPTVSIRIENLADNNITKDYLFYNGVELFRIACIIISHLVFILCYRKKELVRNDLIAAIIFYFFADLIYTAYEIYKYNSVDYYSIIFDLLCVIIVINALFNPKNKLAAIIILLIDAAFNLLSVFNGDAISFSKFILISLLIGSLYFYQPNQTDTYFYN